MAEEKQLGGNTPESTGAATDPADKQTTVDTDADALESEIDGILNAKDDDSDIDEDDTVAIPKKKLEKLEASKENYRKGLLSAKDKIKGFKKAKPAAAAPAAPANQPKPNAGDTPITATQLNEREAIKEAEKDSVLNDNWQEVMKYYTPRHGKDSVKAILKDIEDAKTLFLKDNPDKAATDDQGEEDATATVAADTVKPKAGSQGNGKTTPRKSILPKRTSPSEWYPKKQ